MRESPDHVAQMLQPDGLEVFHFAVTGHGATNAGGDVPSTSSQDPTSVE